jgi:hypothetical protein
MQGPLISSNSCRRRRSSGTCTPGIVHHRICMSLLQILKPLLNQNRLKQAFHTGNSNRPIPLPPPS